MLREACKKSWGVPDRDACCFAGDVAQMGDRSCTISGVMARPATARHLLHGYLDALGEHDRERASSAFDLSLDGPGLARFAGARGQRAPDVESLLRRMVATGQAHRLQAGRYLVNRPGLITSRPRLDDLEPVAGIVLRRLAHEYYLSWHTGLWHHGLIEQQSRTVLCAVTVRKRPVRLGAQTVRFVSIAPRKFFGFARSDSYELPVSVADLEKTLLDSLDAPALAGPMPVVIAALDQAARQGTLDPERLVAYAIRMGGPVLNRRLGYFMEKLNIPGAGELEPHLGRKSAVTLQPGRAPRAGAKVNPRWRVYDDDALVSSAKELK
jgi:predicted transcriptional regulator of viral defense system